MQKWERWFVVGLIAIMALITLLVIAGPLLERRTDAPETPEPSPAPGQTETMTARVVKVLEAGTIETQFAGPQPYQRLLLSVQNGSLAGQEVIVEEGAVNIVGQERLFKPGERVYLERALGQGQGQERLYITDYVRTGSLFWIALLFVGLVVLVSRGKGVRALLGAAFSLFVILGLVLPQIKAGHDPLTVCVVNSVMLLSVSTYLIYGWNLKAHAALAGMSLSLMMTVLLAWLFVGWAHFSGFGTEESAYLLMEIGPGVSLKGIVLGGIIIGSLGALDDVCINQASVVFELVHVNRDLGWLDLFRRSLNIGRDHIASMVNTLLLAYVGASLPLVMVFTIYQEPIVRRLNREPIAEEIVRTLVGSIGLVLAVPLTSLIASLLARWAVRRENEEAARLQLIEEER